MNQNQRPVDLDKLEKRAQDAINGYSADINITCYVYAQDVLALTCYVRHLEEKLKAVAEEFRHCVTTNGRTGPERMLEYQALGAVSTKNCCKLLGVEPGQYAELRRPRLWRDREG